MTSRGQNDVGAAAIGAAPRRSEELRLKIGLARQMGPVQLAEPTLDTYIGYLQRMHDVVRASVPLMRLARTRCGRNRTGRKLATYFEMHIVEEDGHDELALQDLEELGVTRADMAARLPNRWLAAMVGTQYYWVEHVSPMALLGYIAFLEDSPPTKDSIAAVQVTLPHGVDAVRALRIHCEADPFHKVMLDELIDSLGLDDRDAALIGTSALHTAFLITQARAGAQV